MINKNLGSNLKVLKCDCGKLFVAPRYICNKCGGTSFSRVSLNGSGEVYSALQRTC